MFTNPIDLYAHQNLLQRNICLKIKSVKVSTKNGKKLSSYVSAKRQPTQQPQSKVFGPVPKRLCGSHIRLCLFTFRPIASKQLNSLTTIVTFSWLGGAQVTHPLWLRDVPGSIPGSGKGFMFDFCFDVVVFLLFCPNTHYLLLIQCNCNFFCNVNLFCILVLNILQDVRPIIRT